MMLPHFLKRYLYLNDYKNLCVALRTLADTSDTTGQSLMKLYRSQRFALETEPQSNSSDANFQQLVPVAAFLLDHKHLTCPLPWLENGTLLSIATCLEILSDLLIIPQQINDPLPVIKLASVSLFLRLETDADLPAILIVIRNMLKHHCTTLKAVSITVCSQAPRPLHRSKAVEATSETALHHYEDHCELKQTRDANHQYLPLELDSIVFPELESLQLSLPFSASNVKLPRLQALHLSYLNDEIISIWSKDVQNDDMYIECQAGAIEQVIHASALTLKSLTISGAVRLRSNNNLFDAPIYLPSLVYVNLGWTTAAELDSLHQALLAQQNTQLKEILSYPISVHSALSKAESISDISISFNNVEGTTQVPPRLPAVRHVVFNGPLRMGLTDRHLAIYAQVIPRGNQEELLLQYGILNVTLAGCLDFRAALWQYCHCTMFRHPASLLHKILARRSFKEVQSLPPTAGGGLDFPSRYSKSKLKDLFLYEHITPDVRTSWRKVTRLDTYGGACEPWPDSSEGSIPPPPTIGKAMTGKDLFALEFWQLPQLIRQDENRPQIESVYELWDSDFVSQELRELYDQVLVRQYVCERELHYPFTTSLPWWERNHIKSTHKI